MEFGFDTKQRSSGGGGGGTVSSNRAGAVAVASANNGGAPDMEGRVASVWHHVAKKAEETKHLRVQLQCLENHIAAGTICAVLRCDHSLTSCAAIQKRLCCCISTVH